MAQENTKRTQYNERGGIIMDTGNITWVITLESGTPKVEIVRKTTTLPKLECPSPREMMPEWDSGIYLSKEKGMRINMIRIIYSICREQMLVDLHGNRLPDCKIYQWMGRLFHADFSNYHNDLNRSMEENTRIETQTRIFRNMSDHLKDRYDAF